MKDLLDPRFNHGGSEGEVGSTESPQEPNRAGIYLSVPGLSETMSGTMSKLHLSGPHLSQPH